MNDPKVLIPYEELCRLMDSASRLPALEKDISRLLEMQAALKYQFSELLQRFQDLYDSVNN